MSILYRLSLLVAAICFPSFYNFLVYSFLKLEFISNVSIKRSRPFFAALYFLYLFPECFNFLICRFLVQYNVYCISVVSQIDAANWQGACFSLPFGKFRLFVSSSSLFQLAFCSLIGYDGKYANCCFIYMFLFWICNFFHDTEGYVITKIANSLNLEFYKVCFQEFNFLQVRVRQNNNSEIFAKSSERFRWQSGPCCSTERNRVVWSY